MLKSRPHFSAILCRGFVALTQVGQNLAFCSQISPTSRIGGVKTHKWLENQPVDIKGLHYRAVDEVA